MRAFGQIIKLEASRGFFFIAGDDGTDYFAHMSSCRAYKSLRLHDRVSFVPTSVPKGPRAEDVAVAS